MEESKDKYIALLRGINVGGKRKLLMADLKEISLNPHSRDTLNLMDIGKSLES